MIIYIYCFVLTRLGSTIAPSPKLKWHFSEARPKVSVKCRSIGTLTDRRPHPGRHLLNPHLRQDPLPSVLQLSYPVGAVVELAPVVDLDRFVFVE